MTDRKNIALAGAALLFVGVFMPIVSMPIVGNINYFNNGRGDGAILLLFALVAAALALTGRLRHVVWPGAASAAMLVFAFYRFQSGMSEMRTKMESELAGNPFREIAEAAMGSVQLQWGWAVLALGTLLLLYAGIVEWRAQETTHSSDDPAG